MENKNNTVSFTSVTGILCWAGGEIARYLSTDYSMPYVLKNGLWHYFTWNEQEKKYYLSMTSERDLQERK